MVWNDDSHDTYQADEDFTQLPKRDLFYELLKLIEQEDEAVQRVRKAEDEVRQRLIVEPLHVFRASDT